MKIALSLLTTVSLTYAQAAPVSPLATTLSPKATQTTSVLPGATSKPVTPKPVTPKPVTPKVVPPSTYFVIQNIATEKTRIYERCVDAPGCPHRLVMEADMVVGRPEEGTKNDPDSFKTWVGHSKIANWVKFYQDRSSHYPHWYKEGQDIRTIPPRATLDAQGRATSPLSWGRQWRVRDNGHDTMYGAFGWFAAMLTPEVGVNQQWMHGTIGWGADGEAAIYLTRSTLLNMFSNPGSSGCTRLSNASIAFMRHILTKGTDIYRVYARESARVPDCMQYARNGRCEQPKLNPRYESQTQRFAWNYILLTDGAQKAGGLTADANTILRENIPVIPGQNLIERGTSFYDQYPNPMQRNYTASASSGRSGDRYEIDSGNEGEPSHFRGYYLVDEGRFVDYQHPSRQETNGKVITGGLDDFKYEVPEILVTTGEHTPPPVIYSGRAEDRN